MSVERVTGKDKLVDEGVAVGLKAERCWLTIFETIYALQRSIIRWWRVFILFLQSKDASVFLWLI